MSIFSFFNKTGKTGKDSIVSSTELGAGSETASLETQEVTPTLSISQEWEISKEQEYVLKFLSNDLPPLQANQLSLAGIDIEADPYTGDWNVQAFFRSSLERPFTMEKAELVLQDGNKETIASQEFDLSELGSIPALSNRPWIFKFKKDSIQTAQVPTADWSLAFNVQSLVPHALDLDISWEEALSSEKKSVLRDLVQKLPKLNSQELNLTGFQTSFSEDGNLAVSVFIRNGYSKQIELENLPLEIIDATGSSVVKGSFKLAPLTVKANTTKPWTFIFPKDTLQVSNPDLSRWTARIPN
ncbi:accessory Sec system S-layer assembly protein [Planococcus faecalis]|uniref:Accessory Sec system S-layer assembly protein n=1 Tax=Planococcus faecalis TaxID=1598147 RepID=A0ABM6IUT3_9BACL|nr:accessory Sec system S-layer assembly protein [Planococcus faecalis]AQU80140.1 accessory Sec system S-layer assembly protein [Planococcus faecalis]